MKKTYVASLLFILMLSFSCTPTESDENIDPQQLSAEQKIKDLREYLNSGFYTLVDLRFESGAVVKTLADFPEKIPVCILDDKLKFGKWILAIRDRQDTSVCKKSGSFSCEFGFIGDREKNEPVTVSYTDPHFGLFDFICPSLFGGSYDKKYHFLYNIKELNDQYFIIETINDGTDPNNKDQKYKIYFAFKRVQES